MFQREVNSLCLRYPVLVSELEELQRRDLPPDEKTRLLAEAALWAKRQLQEAMETKVLATIRQILLDEWDPVGVGRNPHASDEYDSYAPRIHALLKVGHCSTGIAAFLVDAERASSIGFVRSRMAS